MSVHATVNYKIDGLQEEKATYGSNAIFPHRITSHNGVGVYCKYAVKLEKLYYLEITLKEFIRSRERDSYFPFMMTY